MKNVCPILQSRVTAVLYDPDSVAGNRRAHRAGIQSRGDTHDAPEVP
jgi:hypothetical protein